MPNACKVISTYFGPRRDHPSGVEETMNFLERLLDHESSLDPGYQHDTIIVNHDITPLLPAAATARDWLTAQNNRQMATGQLKVLHRSWDEGRGGSFGSFNYAYQQYKNQYKYWFFTEDDVVPVRTGYLRAAIKQIEENSRLGFVCAWRYTPLGAHRTNPHCHGGCGLTTARALEVVSKEFQGLPHSQQSMSKDMIHGIQTDPRFRFDDDASQKWYRAFELEGEVMFTNAYLQVGLELADLSLPGPVIFRRNHMY